MGVAETAKNITAAAGGIDPAEMAAANRLGNYGSWGTPTGLVRTLRLSYPNSPIGREPTYDDMEELAKRDKAFATNWAQLKAEKAASERYGSRVKPEQYAENQARQVYENLRQAKAATPGPTEPLPDFETFKHGYLKANEPARNRSLWNRPKSLPIPTTESLAAPDHARGYYDQYAGRPIPGITRPPLTNEEITKMAWGCLVDAERQRIKQNHPMAWAEEGLGAAGQMALTLGAAEAVAPMKGVGALARGLTHGAMSDVAAQALEVGSGKRERIDPIQTAISSAIFGGASKVSEIVAGAIGKRIGPMGKEFVEDYGLRGQRIARAEAAGKLSAERVARMDLADQAAVKAIQDARKSVQTLAAGGTLTLNEVANIARERMAASGSGHDPEPLMQRLIRGFLAIGVGHFAGIGKGGIPEEEQIARVREARVTKDQAEQVLKQVQEEIGNREQRRSELQAAMEPPPTPNALDQAKAAITRDIKSNPKSIEMMAHPEYAQRIAEQFGLDAEQSKELAQHALEVATAPVHGPPMQPRETVPQTVPQGEPVKPGEILKNARRARKVKDKSLVDLIGDVDRSEARSGREELLASGLNPEAAIRPGEEPGARARYKAYKAKAEAIGDRIYSSFGEGLGRHVRDLLMQPRTPADQLEFVGEQRTRYDKTWEEINRAQRKTQRFIDKIALGDPAKAKAVERLFFLETEQDNPKADGSGQRQGIPESERAWYTAEKAKYRPEVFAEGKRLWKEYGKAALGVGEMAEKAGLWPTAVLKRDTLPGQPVDEKSLFFRDIKEGRRSLQSELDAGYKVVGGAEFFRQAGHYLTHGFDFGRTGDAKAASFFQRLPNTLKQLAAYRSKAFNQAMSRRKLSLGEAIDQGLKMSTEETAIRLGVELDAIQKKEFLDHLRSTRALRLEDDAAGIHELPRPETVDLKATREKQVAIDAKIDRLREQMAERKLAIKKAVKAGGPDAIDKVTALTEKQVAATEELRALRSERISARLTNDVAGWTELKDPAFGEYASQENGKRWFIRNDMLGAIGPQRYRLDPLLRVGGAALNLVKMFKTGLGQPLRVWSDALTNLNEARDAGYSVFTENGAKEWGRAKSLIWKSEVLGEREKINDPMLDEYEAATRGTTFGGVGDIAQHDQAQVAKYRKQLERALRDDVAGDIVASGAELTVAKLNAFLDKPPKWMNVATGGASALYGVGREIYRGMTDKSDGLFIYTMARKYGPDGSGPMEPHEAAAEVAHVFDMRNMARGVQLWTMLDSFGKYPLKKIESYMNSALLEPRFFGKRIPTPLDRMIWSNPGSPAATKALAARSAMRLGLQAIEKALVVGGIAKMALSAQGKPGESEEEKKAREEKWDKQLDALYSHSARPTAALMKLFTVPMGIGPDGKQRVLYLDFAAPWMATARHFTTDDRTPFLRKAINLNVLLSDAAPAIAGTSWTNDLMREGYGPGSRNWPILSTVLPVALTDADEILMKLSRDPRWREDIAFEIAKYLTQAKLYEIKSNASLRAEEQVRKYEQEGKITFMENKENGGRYPVISSKVSPAEREGIKAWLMLSLIPSTADELRVDVLRNMQDFRMNQIR